MSELFAAVNKNGLIAIEFDSESGVATDNILVFEDERDAEAFIADIPTGKRVRYGWHVRPVKVMPRTPRTEIRQSNGFCQAHCACGWFGAPGMLRHEAQLQLDTHQGNEHSGVQSHWNAVTAYRRGELPWQEVKDDER